MTSPDRLLVEATEMTPSIRDVCVEEEINVRMSFFLHIPFPSWDIMRIFPWSDEILQGMLGCDMVGFHTEDYCINFLDCC